MMKRVLATAILGIGITSAGMSYAADVVQSDKLTTIDTTTPIVSVGLSETLKPSDLRVWGNENAPVSLYLFSSPTCPHCAVFHEQVWPVIRSQFIETGKAKLIAVDMPYDAAAITATMMMRCIEPKLYEDYAKAIYQNQSTWGYAQKPRALMEGYARVLGADMEKLDLCVRDYDLRQTVTQQRNNLSTLYKVTGMPTLIIIKNGHTEKISGTDTPVIIEKIQSVME